MTPASLRIFRWCETVGWRTSQQDVKSHAQTSLVPLSSRRIARRVGWASAWSSWTSGSTRFVVGRRGMPASYRRGSILTRVDIRPDDGGDKHQGEPTMSHPYAALMLAD